MTPTQARLIVAVVLVCAIMVVASVVSARAEPAPGREDYYAPQQTQQSRSLGQGRPAGCPRLWCGCWARLQVGLPARYNLARNWLDLPRTNKQVGAWVVLKRKGGGHVGRVVDLDASGNPIVESGNHGGRVGVGTYSKGRVLAYVVPR